MALITRDQLASFLYDEADLLDRWRLPEWLQGRFDLAGVGIGRYRLFIVVICAVLTVLLQWVLSRTRFGSRLRASACSITWPISFWMLGSPSTRTCPWSYASCQ